MIIIIILSLFEGAGVCYTFGYGHSTIGHVMCTVQIHFD